MILDLKRIVLGGGISQQPVVLKEIIHQYEGLRQEEPLLLSTFEPIEIVTCAYKNQSNLLGALYHLFLQLEKTIE